MLEADEGGSALGERAQGVERDRYGRPAGDVVEEERQRAAPCKIGEVFDQTALRRADVIGSDDQERVGADRSGVLGELDRLGMRLAAGGHHDRQTSRGRLERDLAQALSLRHAEQARLGGRAVHDDAVAALPHLEVDERGVGVAVDPVATERRDERRIGAAQELSGECDHVALRLSSERPHSTCERLVANPASAPRTRGGRVRSSCQSNDSIIID